MEGSTHHPQLGVPIIEAAVDELALFAAFGVGDLVGVEGTEERKVRLSRSSNVVCPLHYFELVPDACRSCWFLAGSLGGVKR